MSDYWIDVRVRVGARTWGRAKTKVEDILDDEIIKEVEIGSASKVPTKADKRKLKAKRRKRQARAKRKRNKVREKREARKRRRKYGKYGHPLTNDESNIGPITLKEARWWLARWNRLAKREFEEKMPGVAKWTLVWNTRLGGRVVGYAHYGKRRISLAPGRSYEATLVTLAHEYAHHLTTAVHHWGVESHGVEFRQINAIIQQDIADSGKIDGFKVRTHKYCV